MNGRRISFMTPIVVTLGLAVGAAAEDIRVPHARGEVVLPAPPQRIAVFDLPTLDTVNALGKSGLVVAVPKPADRPANFPAHLSVYAEDRFAPAGTVFEPDAEALKALGPDLIVVGGRSRGKYDEMGAIAPTIDMSGGEGDLVANVVRSTETLGRLLGAQEAAETRIAAFTATVAEVRDLGRDAGTGLVLFGAGQGVSAQPPGSRFGAVYDLVGITPVMEPAAPDAGPRPEAGTPEAEAARVRQQEVLVAALAAEPDWIFVIDRNAAVGNAEGEPLADRLAKDERVTATKAWQADRVIHLDARTWYLMGGGIDAISASAEAVAEAFAAAQ
ncbi:iron ABC transporter substrate-binding protein [Sinirhodobacter populi]|uniref:Iron ABC transporter substrate-binding protein n=1 Tax=Paenirhodobacter populi TaxID=2306993 RepID=A0A443KEL3_9RHOB|nr:ABC transporter substrate-binding protein [Sinirhodobacter populi]RWR31238.1 iron ABC transporter substrate-binding protein [Sinirhodobacter populi]